MNQDSNKQLIGIDEISKATGLRKSFLRQMVFKKAVPFYKIGRRIYFKIAEIDQWLIAKKSQEEV